MMRPLRVIPLVIVMLIVSACASNLDDGSLTTVARDFCKAGKTKEGPLHLTSPSLRELITAAQPSSTAIAFQSHPELAATALCRRGKIRILGGAPRVEIVYDFADREQPDTGWTDIIELTNVDGRWMIDNVLFAPDHMTDLRQRLRTSP